MSKFWTVTRYIFVIAACAAILIMTACVVVGIGILRSRPERRAADVFGQGSGTGYSHVAVFARGGRALGTRSPLSYLDDGTSLSVDDIGSIRMSLQGVVDLASGNKKTRREMPEKLEGWSDCYSTFLKSTVSVKRKDNEEDHEADIYAVEGSFTVMHPFEFMSGGFLTSDTTDRYQVVLNDALAWKIYSSYDVTGERISLLGRDYTVIGVVREHEGNAPRAYISFACLEEYCGGLDTNVIPAVMCYEAIIPEQARGSARLDVCNAIPGYNISSPDFRVISVTGRYNIFKAGGEENPSGYELPYWEENALKAESDIKTSVTVFAFGLVLILGLALGFVSSMAFARRDED